MTDVAVILGIVVAATGLAIGYLSSRRAKLLVEVVRNFAVVAQVYYQSRPDGWLVTEKEALANATIAFFDAVENAGIEIARPQR